MYAFHVSCDWFWGIEYKELDTKEEVMEWMLDIQLGRRNLSSIQRIAVAEKYRPIYEKQAKERQSKYYGNQYDKKNGLTVNLPQVQNNKDRNPTTDKKLSDIAGVGTGTVARFNKVMNSDDEILLDLLESNIRRRGEVGGSAKKTGLRIKELERLYGIQNGSTHFQGNQYSKVVMNNSEAPKTQEQLAKDMGMSVDTLQNYKMLADMIPELDELVQTD